MIAGHISHSHWFVLIIWIIYTLPIIAICVLNIYKRMIYIYIYLYKYKYIYTILFYIQWIGSRENWPPLGKSHGYQWNAPESRWCSPCRSSEPPGAPRCSLPVATMALNNEYPRNCSNNLPFNGKHMQCVC